MILCIETATSLCSVALCDRDGIAGLKENAEGRSHASLLTVFIDELLNKKGIGTQDLDAVAVSKGPGSYTGLRIGVSVAKGIAYASSIPLIGIDTTLSMFRGFLPVAKEKYGISADDLFCPVLDARRMEVYYSVYSSNGNQVKKTSAEIIDGNSFKEYPESSVIYIFGEGAVKCKEVIKRKNIIVDEEFRISASFMHGPVYESFYKSHFEDVAYFEPFYLKNFLTTQPVKNILGK
jgi:tRNA threonylcarbamoyladenosine biosynthesis protein TsaB